MTTTQRTDIHAPGSDLFDPEDYDCFLVYDSNPEWPNPAAVQHRLQLVNSLLEQGWTRAGAPHGGNQCDHCGHWPLRYIALMGHRPTRTLLHVGETCLDNRFSITKAEFATLRKAAKLNRERISRRERAEAVYDANPGLAYITYAYNLMDVVPNAWAVSTMADIAYKIDRYGDPTDRQVKFAFDLLTKATASYENTIARKAEAEALRESGVEVPTGRIVVEGEVVGLKWVDDNYSPYGGTILKMIVKSDAGWKVYGTVPSSLSVEKGDRVRFTATVERSNDDALFGFFKRPTKATTL